MYLKKYNLPVNCIIMVHIDGFNAHKCIILQEDQEDPEYGWEYASLGRRTFHTTKGMFDVVRRGRHVHKLVNERPGARPVFALPGKTDSEGAEVVTYDDASSKDGGKEPHVPRMHLEFKGKTMQCDRQCTILH